MPVSLAVGGGDSESDRRIRELLDEGQAAFDAGDPQGAIDSWSRIFLIDIDHQEASRRIEAARKLKAESERQAEEIFHDGVARLESGDAAAARRSFLRVLEIQPGYFAAREYLQQIDAGTVPPPRTAMPRDPLAGVGGLGGLGGGAAEPPLPAPAPPARKIGTGTHDLQEEILVPPEPPGEAAPAERWPLKAPAGAGRRDKGRARRLFLLVGGAVLLLALAGAFYFFQNRDQIFPNSKEEAPAPAPSAKAASDPISRAERLYKAGRATTAISQLKRIPANDPHYAKAQALIAQWGGAGAGAGGAAGAGATGTAAGGAPGAPGANGEPAPPLTPEAQARRATFLAAARQALGEQSSFKALLRLEQADALARLDGDDARLLAETRKTLAPLSNEIDLFHQHEWERLLPLLWRRHTAEPANRDIAQLMVDCYYDLAVRDLQRLDVEKAAASLKEAVALQPGDELLKRHYVFAQTYQERPKDLLYRIYVKYLPYR
jgi:tetratricopeptide (TPR) repeat protein